MKTEILHKPHAVHYSSLSSPSSCFSLINRLSKLHLSTRFFFPTSKPFIRSSSRSQYTAQPYPPFSSSTATRLSSPPRVRPFWSSSVQSHGPMTFWRASVRGPYLTSMVSLSTYTQFSFGFFFLAFPLELPDSAELSGTVVTSPRTGTVGIGRCGKSSTGKG